MARKRIIDPEFWSDEEIGHWTFDARLFYIGLWNFADDEGRFKANDLLLKAQIFPYDTKIDISLLKHTIGSKIQWYEHEGCQYGYIRNFLKHQRIDRPTTSKLPRPPKYKDIDEPSTNPRGDVLPNIREVNISKDNTSDLARMFDDFVKNYPMPIKNNLVYPLYKREVLSEADHLNLMSALNNYKKSDRVVRGFIQNAENWLEEWRGWLKKAEDPMEKWRAK